MRVNPRPKPNESHSGEQQAMNYDHILIPTDGSKAAERATPHAVDLAKKYGATLHVLFVVDIDAVDVSLGTEQVQRIKEGRFDEMEELKQYATDALNRIATKALDQGLDVEESIVTGKPHKQIVKYAEKNDVDLIAMTCHGRTGVRRLLLGSVTEQVLRLAGVPVLVVEMERSR